MVANRIEIPDFDFTAFYYPQILEALIQYKRRNVPELTDESEFEPFIQLLRATALVGHLNNVLIDLVANESTLPTAQLVETVRNMLQLIDYNLDPAKPSQVEVVYELARTFAAPTTVVPALARAATRREGDQPVIFFEANEALIIDPTDVVGEALEDDGGVFTDRTAALNDTDPGADFAPWGGTPAVGDALYVGHPHVMFDALSFTIIAPAVGLTGVWEFYDGDFLKTQPDSVTPVGIVMTVVLNGLLGNTPKPGTTVRVTLNQTGAFEDAVSQWNGLENFVEVGLIGQSSPSSDPNDYAVGSDWSELSDLIDGTVELTQTGDVEYTLPQNVIENWQPVTVDGATAYWVRYRIVQTVAPSSPTLRQARIDLGKQYVVRTLTQGRTAADDPLGSSNGTADQSFETTRDNFISGTQVVTVDGEEWAEVDNFLNSAPNDRHYRVVLGENDRASIVFGSGNQGRIPPVGVNNISVTYRFGAQDDGNVGPNTITVDKQGLTFINSLWNPRQANGWAQAEGSTEESLERAKIAGPASLRIKEVALGPGDVVELATTRFLDEQGSNLYGRALAIEEGLGPKTIELVVVLRGGGLATAGQLSSLDNYFNGTPKRIVANQEVTSFNYTPRPIDVTATVTSEVEAEQIANRLIQILQPEALRDDGVSYEWEFGEPVPTSRLIHEIFSTDDTTTKVVLTSPASDVVLGPRELPTAGTIAITIVAP